jgi:hypothetical protein
MEMNFGRWVKSEAQKAQTPDHPNVVWREGEMINGHVLLVGGSGTGKTHNIRNIIKRMRDTSRQDVRVHLLDVHDDIHIPGASEVLFSESSGYGLNPLVVDPDPHTGGVRKAIQNFIRTINKTSRQLGDRQEAVLRAVLEDLYMANGFYADKPETWALHDGVQRKYPKKFPNVDDLYRWTYFKYKQMFMGGNSRSASTLDSVNKEAAKIQRLVKNQPDLENDSKLEELKGKAIEAYGDYVTTIKTGRELDELLKFDSKTTLKSVLDRVDNLRNAGIFRNELPPFDPGNPVWRYRLKALGSDEKKMFVNFLLKELYDNALKRGEQDNIVEVVVIDEANQFMDSDPDNILSIMANEIRKFGTSLILASQSFTHFSDDFLSSAGTKIVLGIDEMYWDKTCRQLQIKKEWLDWIIPRRTALINMKRNVSPGDPTAKVKWFFTQLEDD